MKCLPVLSALMLTCCVAEAGEAVSKRITDRHGVELLTLSRTSSGVVNQVYPYHAMAAQVLSQLDFTAPALAGEEVRLTLDARIQQIAELAMRQVDRGAAVVINPRNGDILAMVSVPSFDPGEDQLEQLKDDSLTPLVNRAVAAYAPGATYLLITAAAGLRAGLEEKVFECGGGVHYGNKFMKCWITQKGGDTHGPLSLHEGFQRSCNPYFYQLGNSVGIDQLSRTAELLGFGWKTGVPLMDERVGIQPNPQWLEVVNRRETWSDGHTANVSIGQGYVLVTPLQMAAATAAIGNGHRYAPRLVVSSNEPPKPLVDLSNEGLPREKLAILREAMRALVNGPGTQAGRASSSVVSIAGRTGTAQFWRSGKPDNHTWFTAFAPLDAPTLAVSVIVQGAKSGGGVAAPLVKQIIEETLALEENPNPQLRPLPPAAGSFRFIDSLDEFPGPF